MSAVVLIVNVVLTAWASKHYGLDGGFGVIRDGQCSQVKSIAAWLHLGINVLSTLLLGASNYTMQCLSAPTRQDIKRAHSQGFPLKIGTSSVRNLVRIRPSRSLSWLIVALSSVPLHLTYNSAIFTTISIREYDVFLVTPDFLAGAPFDLKSMLAGWPRIDLSASLATYDGVATFNDTASTMNSIAQKLQTQQSALTRLNDNVCIEAYSGIVTGHADVLAVTVAENDTNSIINCWPSVSPTYTHDYFAMGFTNSLGENAQKWELRGWHVDHCLSQPVGEEHCKVQFSVNIMIVVCLCNLGKMLVMGYVAWRRPPEPLVTLGDALQSFLDDPDQTTIGNCLAEQHRFHRLGRSILPIQLPPSPGQGPGTTPTSVRNMPILPYDLGESLSKQLRRYSQLKHENCLACQAENSRLDHWDKKPMPYQPSIQRWYFAPGIYRWFIFASL